MTATPSILRWYRLGASIVHLATQGSSAAYCGQSLHNWTPVASNLRACGHCLRSRRYRGGAA